jgi:hypothetical protein
MGDQLQNMDKTILDNWLQLRVDYRQDTIFSADRCHLITKPNPTLQWLSNKKFIS